MRTPGTLSFACLTAVSLFGLLGADSAARADDGAQPTPESGLGMAPPQTAARVVLDPAEERRHPLATEPRISYALHARLRALPSSGFEIDGAGTVHIENRSPKPLLEIPLHLYMNAFRDGSLARRSPFYDGRASVLSGSVGSIELVRCADERNGAVLLPSPPENDSDRTTATLHLTAPIEPGAGATLSIQWLVRLPRLSQRTGYERDFVFAGQWFPKVAKLGRDGTWTQFAFHPQAEFYSNFGDYDVTLEVPSAWEVGATGEIVDQLPNGAARYRARHVHDFAWTAWPGFARHTEEIAGVRVTVLMAPDQPRSRRLTLETLRAALPWLEAWLGQYPLPGLTVVHPPSFAAAAGGMEYPGLITTGGTDWEALMSHDLERVVLHELGHQWFYGVLANDEHAWPFLDEGLTTYVEDRAVSELFGSSWDGLLRKDAEREQRALARHHGQDVSIATAGPDFPSFAHLAALAYDRAALLLETFHRAHGEPFDRAFRTYARRFRYAHPTPSDFLATLGEALGPQAQELMRIGLFERGSVNYRIAEFQSQRLPGETGYQNRAVVIRHGELAFPTEVEFRERSSDGGAVRREWWDNTTSTKVFEFTSNAPLESVCIDPEARVAIEDSRADNCERLNPPRVPRYWSLLLGLLQWFMVFVG